MKKIFVFSDLFYDRSLLFVIRFSWFFESYSKYCCHVNYMCKAEKLMVFSFILASME